MDLLQEIAHCPIVEECKTDPHGGHPCTAIVMSQASEFLANHQVPEPWSGHLEIAPILFLSSNPSIGTNEDYYPRWSWQVERVTDFFSNRFGGGSEKWICDGRYPLIREGVHSTTPVPFWSSIRLRAIELLQLELNPSAILPGIDYCTSEVVHCKSRSEIGVAAALDTCVSLYLAKVVAQSGASVVVCLGKNAASAVRQTFKVPGDVKTFGPIEIGQRGRMFTFLPHPNAFKVPKSFEKNLSKDEFEMLRAFVRQNREKTT